MQSIDSKIEVLRIIDTLNANKNVVGVWVRLHSYNEWNIEIVTLIINRYTNVYSIYIWDWNDLVDHQIHDQIKQYI